MVSPHRLGKPHLTRRGVGSASKKKSTALGTSNRNGRVSSLLQIEMSQDIALVHLACDNAAALTMVGEPATLAWRSRHISVRGFLLSQAICHSEITFYYVGAADHKADGLTIGQSKDLHSKAMVCWKMTACP